MKRRTKVVNGIGASAMRNVLLLLGLCALSAGAGLAQTSVDPLHAMSPAQLQRAMFSSGPGLTPTKAATQTKPAKARRPKSIGTHNARRGHR